MKAKKVIMKKKFAGEIAESDFEIVEEVLPSVKDGDILCRAEFISVDPYVRVVMPTLPERSTIYGTQIAKVIESKNKGFPVGAYVIGTLGWRTHTVLNPDTVNPASRPTLVPDIGTLPKSLLLGVLGMTGNTAYFGVTRLLEPKPGKTLVVNAAGGAVGSQVGQIARILGCKVIGIAGSKAKCDWITKSLGFDHAINYKEQNLSEALKQAAPSGIDLFFDNVGGEISRTVVNQMNSEGAIAVCGAISSYNSRTESDYPVTSTIIINKRLKIQGHMVFAYLREWNVGVNQNLNWIREGKLKYLEHVNVGFEKLPQAFLGLFRGENVGKTIVQIPSTTS